MNEVAPFTLGDWQSFYVIVGSSAGALTGLQFVVMTLIADNVTMPSSGETLSAFGTPNVVHFCAALLVGAIFSAPWHSMGPPGVATALCGGCGILYSLSVLRRAMRQRDYKPVLEDWAWHAALPLLAYAALLHAGINLHRVSMGAQYIVAGAVLLLVFIGIHNAWDTVTYVTMQGLARAPKPTDASAQVDRAPVATTPVPAEPTPPVPPRP
jgi:hypothetical protein